MSLFSALRRQFPRYETVRMLAKATPTWTSLRRLGQSRLLILTALIPFIGTLILFNNQVVDFFLLSPAIVGKLTGIENVTVETSRAYTLVRLQITYFGLVFLGIASFLFTVFSPPTVRSYATLSDFINGERPLVTLPKMAIITSEVAEDYLKSHGDEAYSYLKYRFLSDLGYELVVREEYKLAIAILEFAKDLRGVTEAKKRRNIVNLANAHKLSGDEKAAAKLLDSVAWSAVNDDFQICVAAIRDDIQVLVRLMKRGGAGSNIGAAEYQQWPVFYAAREKPEFTDTFASVFGVPYVGESRKQAGLAQVMEYLTDVSQQIPEEMQQEDTEAT